MVAQEAQNTGEKSPDFYLRDHLQVLAAWVGLTEEKRTARAQKKIMAPYGHFGPVVFTDGVGFTPLSAQMSPLELAHALHEYRTTVASHTRQAGGTPAYPYWAADETRVYFPHPQDMSVDNLIYRLLAAKEANDQQLLKMRTVLDTLNFFVLDGYLYGPGIDNLNDLIEHHTPVANLYITGDTRKWLRDKELLDSLVFTKKVRNKNLYRMRYRGEPVVAPVDKRGTYPLPFSDQFAAVLERYHQNGDRNATLADRYTWNTPVVFVKVNFPQKQLLLDRLLGQSIADYFIRDAARNCGALVGKSDGALAIATAATPEVAYEFALTCRQSLKTQDINSAVGVGKGDLLISRIGRQPNGTVVDDVVGPVVNELAKLVKKNARQDALFIHASLAEALVIPDNAEKIAILHGSLTLQAYQVT